MTAAEQIEDGSGLSGRARKTLVFLGVTTKRELCELSPSEILRRRGCGRKTIYELKKWAGMDEYLERREIERKCWRAQLFLEKHGYRVLSKCGQEIMRLLG